MPYLIKDSEKIFNQNRELVSKLQSLGSIVQNETIITEQDYEEFAKQTIIVHNEISDWIANTRTFIIRGAITEQEAKEITNEHN